ncbi:ABC-2 type transport system ATP-binding protein [Hathewaya proteolytica DSM 3090]|uniref:ABC-2 type transport system ATP-binding protein n=1 Tax=Hathewaya proteolytica DSM 3090 TaxID=1121331 RepID=A0A1M6RG70_9CLOT|nr:ABC transporter ATP-binding protein [Hathewaya proteolytica]SHK31465.1 ABC-2 type transport system ATP-binding protein [Hathewaya proteolytica DSM 3090]
MELLNVENVNKSYSKKVLDDVNFTINQGEVVGLVGPNGAGKTTLMRILCLLSNADSGEVKLCGISNKSRKEREKYLSNLAAIIETPALYENLSGYDNLDMIRRINNLSKDRMNEIIEFVNIGNMIKHRVKEYSLGMKQRLALGIALINSPKLLILDEPTNGLDYDGIIEFRELVAKVVEENKVSVIISSHILSEVEKMCHRILFLKDGKIIDASVSEKTVDEMYRTIYRGE